MAVCNNYCFETSPTISWGESKNYDRASEVSWLVLIFKTRLVWLVGETLIIINGKISVKLPRKLDSLAIRPLN
jgi:hypothetical protein